MGAGAFLIMFLKNGRKLVGAFFAAIVILFFKEGDNTLVDILIKVAIVVSSITGLALVTAFFSYFPLKFYIRDDKLIFSRNMLAQKTTSIPTSRIHTLRTRRGLAYRLLGVRGVAFDTLASDGEELELILSEKDWEALLRAVRNSETYAATKGLTVPPPVPVAEKELTVSNADIIKGTLCQNHLRSFAVLSAILFPVLDNINQIDGDAAGQAIDYIESNAADLMPTPTAVLFFLAALYILVAVLWTGKTIFRYGNMTITEVRDRLVFKFGLISNYTCRFARDKVTIISVRQNPLEKALRFQTVRIRQALNTVGHKGENEVHIYGWRPRHAATLRDDRLLHWWLDAKPAPQAQSAKGTSLHRPGPEVTEKGTVQEAARSGFGIFYRSFIPQLLIALSIGFVLYHFDMTAFAVGFCTVYIPFAAVRAVMARRHSGIALCDGYVLVNGGNIARISSYLKYEAVESVRLKCTPFTRFTGRVSLSIGTNADVLTIRSLKNVEACSIRARILGCADQSRSAK